MKHVRWSCELQWLGRPTRDTRDALNSLQPSIERTLFTEVYLNGPISEFSFGLSKGQSLDVKQMWREFAAAMNISTVSRLAENKHRLGRNSMA